MAFLDMLGVASILPFMSVLSNPELVQTNAVLNTAFITSGYIGIQTTEQFLFALGVLVFVLLIVLAGLQGAHHIRCSITLCAFARIQHRQAPGGRLFASAL